MIGGARRVWTRLQARAGAVLLVVLWAAAAVPLTLDAAHVVRTHTATRLLGSPTDEVIVQLQEERRLSAGRLADVVDAAALEAQRARTDRAAERLRTAPDGLARRTVIGPDAARRADDLLHLLGERTRLRTATDTSATNGSEADGSGSDGSGSDGSGSDGSGSDGSRADGSRADGSGAGRAEVLAGYTRIVGAALDDAHWLWPDGDTGAALLTLARARETLSQQDAALVAGTVRDQPERARVTRLVLTRRALLAEAAGRLPTASRERLRALDADPATAGLQAMEDKLLAAAPAAGETAAWAAALDEYRTRLRDLEVSAVRASADAAVPGAVFTVAGAGLLAGVGLVAVVAVLRRGRSRTAAPAGVPPQAASGTGTGEADTRLMRLLLEQNRRNQALLHRTLRLLDGLQRRTADEATLGELFRIDHLASRVRRNVEKTVTLTGGTPGRRWTRPVPLVEVVRAAAAETPGFERVSTAEVEPVELDGAAVTDLMHLLAELIENAVVFSPAETRVRISGRRHPDGYRLTIADHGPGMSEDDLRTAAEVLGAAEPPDTDAWDGLYAAGRLADRAGVTVRLGNGDEGGLRAEARLSTALLAADRPTVLAGQAAMTSRPAVTGAGGDE